MYVTLSLNKMYVALRLKQYVCGIKSETICMWH